MSYVVFYKMFFRPNFLEYWSLFFADEQGQGQTQQTLNVLHLKFANVVTNEKSEKTGRCSDAVKHRHNVRDTMKKNKGLQ